MRVVEGLCSVRAVDPPSFAKQRLRGSRARGKRFERHLGTQLRKRGFYVLSGQWFAFVDANGPGLAQTDHILFLPGRLVIVEAKLSFRAAGFSQLIRLYSPLLQFLQPAATQSLVLCCKYLRPGAPTSLIRPLEEAIEKDLSIVHWVR